MKNKKIQSKSNPFFEIFLKSNPILNFGGFKIPNQNPKSNPAQPWKNMYKKKKHFQNFLSFQIVLYRPKMFEKA